MYTLKNKYIDNKKISIIEIKQSNIEVSFMDYGATILSILVPDKNKKFENVLMGFEDLESYINNSIYLNAIIGPTSGRIGNGSFSINGIEYNIERNFLDKANLHGGSETLAYKLFRYEIIDNKHYTKVIFSLFKKQEDSKYPGNQNIRVIYTVSNGEILIEFKASTNEDTLLNLTSHAYFNLSGNLKSNILKHQLYLNSSNAIKLDEYSVPFEVESILNTKLDYKEFREVKSNGFEGIDNPFLIDTVDFSIPCAIVKDDISKRKLEVFTDYECVVCYTHEYPNDLKLVNNKDQVKNMGICFEAQHSPNGINIKGLEDSILRKDKLYNQKTLFRFSIDKVI